MYIFNFWHAEIGGFCADDERFFRLGVKVSVCMLIYIYTRIIRSRVMGGGGEPVDLQ